MSGFLFANPFLLWGLLVAVVPVALHLLLRRRARVEPWAAVQFLNRVLNQQQRQLQVQSWLQLLVRVALLVCLCLAVADPRQEETISSAGEPRPVHRLLILDVSMSMQTVERQTSRFDRAREMARTILSRGRVSDSWQLMTHGGFPEPAIVSRPTHDTDAIRQELDALSPTFQTGDLAATLSSLQELLALVPEGMLTEVVFLSDLQRSDWFLSSIDQRQRLRRLLQSVFASASLMLIDVGSDTPANLAITEVRIPTGFVRPGSNVSIPVTVENFGETAVETTVELQMDSVSHGSRHVRVAGRSSETVVFELTPTTAGAHLLEFLLPDDPLSADNRRAGMLHVRDSLNILIVPGGRVEEESRPAPSVDYLKLALDPPLPGRGASTSLERPFQLTVIDENRLHEADLSDVDVLMLNGLSYVNKKEAGRLAEFVAAGGGLVIALGDQVQGDSYEVNLGQQGVRLLPGELADPTGSPEATNRPWSFIPANPDHPVIAGFADHPEAGLGTSRVYRYFKLTFSAEGDSTVTRILDLSNGDPLLVSHRFGQGTVLLFTTAIDRNWGSWVVWPSFVPLMHETMMYAAQGRTRSLHSLVTEPLRLPSTSVPIAWTASGAGSSSFSGSAIEAALPLDTEPFATPGTYLLRIGNDSQSPVSRPSESSAADVSDSPLGKIQKHTSASWSVVRNVDRKESDLQRVSPSQLRGETLAGVPVEFFTETTFGLSPSTDRVVADASRWSRRLLLVTLALVVIDLVMARYFGFGLLLLSLLLFGGAAVAVWPMSGVFLGMAPLIWNSLLSPVPQGTRVLRSELPIRKAGREHWW